MNMQNINEIYIQFYNFLEPKWLDDLKKFEKFHKIWNIAQGFSQKSLY